MFSTGQMVFAILFIILFTIVVFMSYRKDKKLHIKNYTGVKWVAIAFIIFVIALFCIKFFFKN